MHPSDALTVPAAVWAPAGKRITVRIALLDDPGGAVAGRRLLGRVPAAAMRGFAL
ncbi:hypothetical protein ACWER6_19140 [Streptomyces sp. NPDC004009]